MSASTRPVIAQPDDDGKARAAVEALVADLQAGWDRHDAQIADRRFSADIAWGSPYGATVQGFDTLFAIHQRLKKENRGGPRARYVIDHVLPISADVIVAQVARLALDPSGDPVPPSSEDDASFPRRRCTFWSAATVTGGSPRARTRECAPGGAA